MSGGRDRVQQVWLPEAGVWAAVPRQADQNAAEGRNAAEGATSRRISSGASANSCKKRREASKSKAVDEVADGDQHQGGPAPAAAPAVAPAAVAAATATCTDFTGFNLQHSSGEGSDVEEYEPAPTCPICLTDIIELADKAVVVPCMHTFCYPCISQWLNHKRLCPLCKARVTSVLYEISPSGTHKEREVPPSPKLHSIGSGDVAAAATEGAPLLQRLQDFLGVAGLVDPYEQAHQQPRGSLRFEAGSRRSPYGTRVGRGARNRPRLSGTSIRAAQQAAAGGAAAGPQGPRPYFWRLQQRLQAGGYRPGGGSTGDSTAGSWGALQGGDADAQQPVAAEDYVLLWRRQVYDQDLWAEPLGSEPARISLGSGSTRERRLTEWIDRELRALTGTDDVTILRGFVLGLVVAYGIEPYGPGGGSEAGTSGSGAGTNAASSSVAARRAALTASRRAAEMVAAAAGGRRSSGSDGRGGGSGSDGGGSGGGRGGGGALSSSPEEALRPFLYNHSAHFWHELRCFATAPYNISTYDRMVQYRRYEPIPSDLPQQQRQVAVGGGGGEGSSAGRELPHLLPHRQPAWQQLRQQRAAGRASRWDQGNQGQQAASASAMEAAPTPSQHQYPAQGRQQERSRRTIEPARVVSQPGGSRTQRVHTRDAVQQRQPEDAEVPRGRSQGQPAVHGSAGLSGSGGGSSRNPSPPPLRPALAATTNPDVSLQQQHQRQRELLGQQQKEPAAERVGRTRSRARSRSHSSSPSSVIERHRQRHSSLRTKSRSRSRHGGQWQHRQQQRHRSRSHSRQHRRRDASRNRQGRLERYNQSYYRRSSRSFSPQRSPRYVVEQYSPEQYRVGADDGGDRWGMS